MRLLFGETRVQPDGRHGGRRNLRRRYDWTLLGRGHLIVTSYTLPERIMETMEFTTMVWNRSSEDGHPNERGHAVHVGP